ncbi:MAG: DUF4422 domain-containing protein [Eubacterium sp.]|nr:DUF4422 domain-containing protein [Eubacterium sp.]
MLSQQSQPSPFCIYGAGIVATSVYTAIKALYHVTPRCFLVSDSENKRGTFDVPPAEIDGIAVKQFSEWKRELERAVNSEIIPTTYLVAVPEEHHAVIIETLRSLNYLKTSEVSELFEPYGIVPEKPRIIPITNALENKLMEAYYSQSKRQCSICQCFGAQTREDASRTIIDGTSAGTEDTIPVIQVFQARSHMDKPLNTSGVTGKDYRHHLPYYIYPIQAGAALTTQSITELKDNVGENISAKNRNYCELTATYHAWKHGCAAYKGICHYRRIFDIDDEQMRLLLAMEHEWDVILPYPSVYYPDISREHSRYVGESDWEAMLCALREKAPEYLAAYEQSIVDGEQFFHNFNMLIAKAEVFDDYCEFLFTILERTEELASPKGWERADRFAGYLGENLTTLYFLKNREKLKILYAGKIWLT